MWGIVMSRVSFIFRTDVHLSDKAPMSWKGDYTEEIWSDLEQIGDYARKHKVSAVLDGGDYFHVKAPTRNSHSLNEKSSRIHSGYPCRTYAVEGNHDLAYNNLESLSKQPLGVLFSSGVFHQLREVVFEDGDLRVRVVGVPYQPDRSLSDLLNIQKKEGDTHLIAVVHALATKNPPPSVEDFWNEPVFPYEALVSRKGPDLWCFPPGTPVLDWLYRPVPIELAGNSLAIADRGGSTIVEEVHPPRQVSEDLVHLEVEGIPSLVSGVTTEHPYWVAKGLLCRLPSRSTRRCHPAKGRFSYPCLTCDSPAVPKASWVEAGEIEVGDYVSIPVPKIPSGSPSNPGLARLLGYYSAEGHIVKNRGGKPVAGVGWSFHSDEHSLHEDVRTLVRDNFGLKVHLYTDKRSHCTQVYAFGANITKFFRKHGGSGSKNKSLSSWIWNRSLVDRCEFLRGWLLGDGHARSSKTDVGGATISQTLAFQVFFLSLSIGLHPCFTVRPGKLKRSPAYVISFYGDDGESLSKSIGVNPPERTKTKVSGFFSDGLYFARVREVTRVPYRGVVHNFRTSSSEYLAGGVLVHNCFGHWHRDQGIEIVGGKYFVNQGSVSRGALVRENLERTPKVALLEIDDSGISVTELPLCVAPASEVFDLEKKAMQEREKHDIDQFILRLVSDGTVDPDASIEDNVRTLAFTNDVRNEALRYLEKAEV